MIHAQQEYSQLPHQSPLSDPARLSTGLRQALGPHSQSVAAVIRHSGNDTALQGGEASIGVGRQSNVDGVLTGKELYYMPMTVGSSRIEGTGPDMLNSTNARGTKRSRQVDAEDGDLSRKHGKRLTTKEEVSLFELCNRHADSFGKRSDICHWWKTIAAEFTRTHGRPYSWHSVRRKVEVVTKQRIKFIEDQQQRQRDLSGPNLVQDLMNPQWCAVLDSWIPTWQRWEEAEAQRISKRDEMIRRRSHSKPHPDLGEDVGHGFQDDGTVSSDVLPLTNHTPTPAPTLALPPFELPSSSISASVKLPPGFENMFSNTQSTIPIPPAPVPTPTSPSTGSDQTGNRMVSAVIETLGKLNKHLDAASGDGSTDARASPVISALVQAATESQTQNSSPIPADIERIKEELRQELRGEMRRERSALEERLDSVQRTQEMILEMLRQRAG